MAAGHKTTWQDRLRKESAEFKQCQTEVFKGVQKAGCEVGAIDVRVIRNITILTPNTAHGPGSQSFHPDGVP